MASSAVAAEEWTCGGNLTPPSGWQQDTAFADAAKPNARSLAATDATSKLAARLCAGAGSSGCDFLTAHIRLWKTGSNGKDVCAMATIRSDELAEWHNLSSTLSTLDDKLQAAAAELLHGVGASKRVTIDQVLDMGVPGGQRADWLRARMERFLGRSATLVDAPSKWAGTGVPAGVDVIVRGSLVSRHEEGVATVEALWTARFPNGRRVLSAPVTFPEQAAPHGPADALPTVPASAGLSVRLDGTRGGSLCAGERTQIWLETDSPMFVRVFDLYGAGDALLMYPTNDEPSARLPAHKPVPLGGRLGFEAVPVPGFESERFLVVAAPTESALGPLATAKGSCRVPADLARQLSQGGAIPPGAKVATTGYRITTAPTCPPANTPREGVLESIAALPLCTL